MIGTGSQGNVYRVKNNKDGKYYALKQLYIKNDRDRQLAENEARLLSSFDHKNILKCKESFLYENSLCIISEMCEGGTLGDFIKIAKEKSTKLPEKAVF